MFLYTPFNNSLLSPKFSKNLIIPEAAMFSKILSYHKTAKLVKYYSD